MITKAWNNHSDRVVPVPKLALQHNYLLAHVPTLVQVRSSIYTPIHLLAHTLPLTPLPGHLPINSMGEHIFLEMDFTWGVKFRNRYVLGLIYSMHYSDLVYSLKWHCGNAAGGAQQATSR